MSEPTAAGSRAATHRRWLDLWHEEILNPELPIVDAHHHLWIRDGERYLLDDLLADVRTGHNIVATVFIQCRSMYRSAGPAELRPLGETEFVNGIAAMSASGRYGATRICDAIVGYAELTLGDGVRPILEEHVRVAGGRFRGIRYSTAWDADASIRNPVHTAGPGMLADPTFRAGFAHLGQLDLSYDVMVYHPQIHELRDLARAFPDTRIVLNHFGAPVGIGVYARRRDEVFSDWSRSICDLASCPNVNVKLGGLATTRGDRSLSGLEFYKLPAPAASAAMAAAWRPYVETCVAAFGASRCMFESNFPVDKHSYPYAAYWNACKLLAGGASSSERDALFAGTAARVYRIELPPDD